jgi:hypothetical protein
MEFNYSVHDIIAALRLRYKSVRIIQRAWRTWARGRPRSLGALAARALDSVPPEHEDVWRYWRGRW